MSTQSFPGNETLPVNEKLLAADMPSHRTSIFKELDNVPRVWGRESQSGYTGNRVLTPSSEGGKEYSVDGASGDYEGKFVDSGRRAVPADYGYEMPERYGRKGVTYGNEPFIPLAKNNNTWVPPHEQQKKICGLGQKTLWVMFGVVCLLVISGAVAAGLVAAASSRSAAR
jgi:hypothetical protein